MQNAERGQILSDLSKIFMKISFTGTRLGMSAWQKQQVEQWLVENRGSLGAAAHGLCMGADIEFHNLLRKVCGRSVYIAGFPSTSKTRVPDPPDIDYIAPPKHPLDRDKDIVNFGKDLLLATPKQMQEILRSGTWTTVRYARRKNVKVHIFWSE